MGLDAVAPYGRPVFGRWYMQDWTAAGTAAPTANRAYAMPFLVPRRATLSGLALEVVAAFTTAGNVRAGLYTDNQGVPDARTVTDYGTVAATVGVKTWAVSTALRPGIYWATFAWQGGSAGTPTYRSPGAGYAPGIGDLAGTPNLNTSHSAYFQDTGFTGAFPANYGFPGGQIVGPRYAIRFSA
jgi:hypothetical protein